MLGAGAALRDDPANWTQAQHISRETMLRVKHNIDLLIDRLPEIGYEFDRPGNVLTTPPTDIELQIERVETTIGPLPLAFRSFWEIVGSVDLNGKHPDWPHRLLDPLMFEASADYYIDTFNDMIDQGVQTPHEPFLLDFAPDDLHKADISGGPPYAVHAPNQAVDGIVLWEIHQTTFVNYLRIVLRHGGMGGVSPTPRHGHRSLEVPQQVIALAAEMEPF